MPENGEDYSDTTVIVPIKNEPEYAVESVVEDIMSNMKSCNIIVVYKGENVIKKSYPSTVMLLKQKSNGKGAACYEAEKLVDTPIVCFIDGDTTYSAQDLKKLIEEVRNGADLAIGNRMHDLNTRVMPKYVQTGNKILTAALNVMYGTHVKDSQTGLRAIKKGAFESLNMREQYFGFEEEMLIKAKRKNYNIVELPISYKVREGVSKQMKPVDGIKLLLILFRHLFDSK
ncbi:MAG: glycosyltransferase family 2 protein [Candidatus Marsarchaeota archaeon]|jgi:glycosyltransferase involved in cell wall biosynthesis|nr:glycosyltransferase family 2 protein [Candidatus Marsarchaeota archaeon]MCL5418846.1 glycosyltransferase family 2 protein [Candidatus Marsarchaeota archaeon]